MARVTNPASLPAARRAHVERMTRVAGAHPELIGGSSKRIDTELLRASRGRLFAKIGAEAVHALGVVGADRALALKVDDGGERALHALVFGLLEALDVARPAELAELASWRETKLQNYAGPRGRTRRARDRLMDAAPRPPPRLAADAHKGDAGRVLCVAGSETMPGAALLCARAAQRAGAGLVAVGCLDAALLALVPAAAPEAVLVDLTESFERGGRVRPGAAERLLARAPHAVLLGPGLGDDARTRAVLSLALASFEVPLVLDADALNALDGEPERLRACARARSVLTPHPGEAARLLGREVPRDAEGRARAARELAERAGALVCLKGRGTVVAEPADDAGSTRAATRAWPRPARATCWPGARGLPRAGAPARPARLGRGRGRRARRCTCTAWRATSRPSASARAR
jgi:hydroxyethylthiazole kinase-like uncharacterized protein yjeF